MNVPDTALAALEATPPSFPVSQLAAVVDRQFDLRGDYRPLVSERDQNFHLTTAGGENYVVKVSSPAEPAIVSDFQIAALQHLERSDAAVPVVVRTLQGRSSGSIRNGAGHCRLRVVSYLEGTPMAALPVDSRLAAVLGEQLAKLDAALETFSHPGDRPELLWDLQRTSELRSLLAHIDAPEARAAVSRALDDFASRAEPGLLELGSQVIHGDANPGNVLIDPQSGEFGGFIDFGDMVRAPRVVDVAIAAAYLRAAEPDPLALIVAFVAGYNSVSGLGAEEQALLFDLIRARLAATITLLFWRLAARPKDDPYRAKTLREEADAIRFLDRLEQIGRSGFLGAIAQSA